MAKELNEDTTLQLSIKTLAGIAVLIFTLVGMWFTLQSDISEAKELPKPPDPEITRMEYDMKDQLIRQTIMTTQDDVKEIKTQMLRMEDKIDELESRLQELEEILPDCDITDENKGNKEVNSDPILWYLVNAVKELSVKVTALEAG